MSYIHFTHTNYKPVCPYIHGCMYVCVSIIIYCLIGNTYDSITLDTGAYMSYFRFSYGSLWAAQIHNIPEIPIREDDVLF